ncbi:BBP7 family outer membrane beta-barrel protein [Aeoliella sp. SH292]|uniref:BBP7 family outer membrane beta-barrel protein n=1 Tax=Aeoliella sp. SH292 TaxID=3454464 RepID=UPI003F9A2A76
MSASSLKATYLALLVMAGFASTVRAQLDDPNSPFYGPSNDMRFFEPVDLDIDGRDSIPRTGFFFQYNKLAWATTGERVEIGDKDTIQRWFQIYDGVPTDPTTGNPIVPPIIPNSIKNAVPRANWSMGDRYEFGFWGEKGGGWLISILNGPDDRQFAQFGLNGGRQGGFQDGLQSPIGDVFVAFRTDPGLLASFVDMHEDAVGPGGGILPDSDAGNGILDGDGIADDINRNGVYGPDGVRIDDEFFIVPTDYGDLVILPISFGLVNIHNTTKFNGFELMRGHRLSNSHFMEKHQNNHFEWGFGARFLQIDDTFQFEGLGVRSDDFGIDDNFDNADWSLGDTLINQQITNNIVGPQLSFNWAHQRGRWVLSSAGKFMLGLNVREWKQRGYVGEDLTPGRTNNYLFIPPQSFSHGRSDSGISPTGELRLDLAYMLTDNISLKLGYTGTVVTNIRRASTHVDYVLNEGGNVMGFANVNEGEDILANGVNFGVEITQ